MNIQEQEKLYDLFSSRQGYSIKIRNGYVDSFVHAIEPNKDEKGREFYQYDSEVYSVRSLREVPSRDVMVYKAITDWQNIEIK